MDAALVPAISIPNRKRETMNDLKSQAKELVELIARRECVSRDISSAKSHLEHVESKIAAIKQSMLELVGNNIPTRTITTDGHVVVVDKDTGVRVFDAE